MADNAYWFIVGSGVVGQSRIWREPVIYPKNTGAYKTVMLGNYDRAIKTPGWNISKPHDQSRRRFR